jgi:TorA maturation chaperone TorD
LPPEGRKVKDMDENLLRFLMLAIFISLALAIAAVGGELSSYSFSDPFESYYPSLEYRNVSQLLSDMPLDRHVSLSGTVSRIDKDYTSEKGYEYQQFFVTDGQKEVKVFCSKYRGSVDVSKGDSIFLSGKFQKFYQTLEIYTDCNSVNIL